MAKSSGGQIFCEDRRQFVISDRPVNIEGWKIRPVGKCFLTYHPELSITENPDEGSLHLGESWLEGQSGRFVVITGDTLTIDTCALRPIWYGKSENRPLIASNPGLISRLSGKEREVRRYSDNPRFNWCPMPGSPLPGFSRLLRDQSLNISTLEVGHSPRLIVKMPSLDMAANAMAEHLTKLFHEMHADRILLSLTAGLDSRTLLAAMMAAGTRFETVTLAVSQKSASDISIAASLSRSLGVKHHVIKAKRGPTARADYAAWDSLTLAASSDAIDKILIPGRFYRFLRQGDLLVRGGCFEVGRRFYHRQLDGLDLSAHDAESVWKGMAPEHVLDPRTKADLDVWMDWRRRYSDGLTPLDSFYLDQRVGGWLALEELALDATPAISVQPAASDIMLSSLISGSREECVEGRVQIEAIRQLAPRLLETPINPVHRPSCSSRFYRKFRAMSGM